MLLPGWRGNEASSSHLSGNMPGHGWCHTTRANTSPRTRHCFHFSLVCPMRFPRWSASLRHMVSSSAVTIHIVTSLFSPGLWLAGKEWEGILSLYAVQVDGNPWCLLQLNRCLLYQLLHPVFVLPLGGCPTAPRY